MLYESAGQILILHFEEGNIPSFRLHELIKYEGEFYAVIVFEQNSEAIKAVRLDEKLMLPLPEENFNDRLRCQYLRDIADLPSWYFFGEIELAPGVSLGRDATDQPDPPNPSEFVS